MFVLRAGAKPVADDAGRDQHVDRRGTVRHSRNRRRSWTAARAAPAAGPRSGGRPAGRAGPADARPSGPLRGCPAVRRTLRRAGAGGGSGAPAGFGGPRRWRRHHRWRLRAAGRGDAWAFGGLGELAGAGRPGAAHRRHGARPRHDRHREGRQPRRLPADARPAARPGRLAARRYAAAWARAGAPGPGRDAGLLHRAPGGTAGSGARRARRGRENAGRDRRADLYRRRPFGVAGRGVVGPGPARLSGG